MLAPDTGATLVEFEFLSLQKMGSRHKTIAQLKPQS